MKISTKGRYALRVMIDLAEHDNGEYITLMDIAERQGISEKYLESIVSMLSKNDFLTSLRGKGGGYKLSRRPWRPAPRPPTGRRCLRRKRRRDLPSRNRYVGNIGGRRQYSGPATYSTCPFSSSGRCDRSWRFPFMSSGE